MIIGITGNIGSGKSYVSKIFMEYGIPVYDTDSRAKEILNTNINLRKELIDLLGSSIYKDGELNKKVMTYYLFNEMGYTEKINSIVHPYVTKDFKTWSEEKLKGNKIIAVESAILINTNLANHVDKIVFVDAPKELRIKRTIRRDNCDEKSVIDRMGKQPSDIEYKQKADYIIYNDEKNDINKIVKGIITF